jgi:hypothetical protein
MGRDENYDISPVPLRLKPPTRRYGGIAPRRLTFRPLKGVEALSWGQVQCSGEKTSFHAESAEPKKGRGPMIEGVISDLSRDLSPNESGICPQMN